MTPGGSRRGISVCAGPALAVLGVLLQGGFAAAQEHDPDVRVVVAASPRAEARPGTRLTLSFRVVNLRQTDRTLVERIDFPRSWKLLVSDSPFMLQGVGTAVRLVTFHLPQTAPPGPADILYALHDAATGEEVSLTPVSVVVQTRRDLHITSTDARKVAASGRPYSMSFSLWMEGNSGGWVSLDARSSGNYQVVLDSSEFYLLPGETRLVNVSVTTPERIPLQRRDLLTLFAAVVGDTVPAASSTVAVEVLPVDGEPTDFRHRVPAYGLIRNSGENGSGGFQAEVGISGPVVPGREGVVDFLVRTPDLQRYSILGPLDEYRVGYAGRNVEAVLGDHIYALSPLTEFGRYAFGGAASVAVSEVTLGGFYNRTRLSSRPNEEVALFAAMDLTQMARLSFQALGKQDPRRSHILSFRAQFRPMPTSTIDAEFGRSYGEQAQDDALSLRWFGRSPLAYYDVWYLRSGTDYTGYFRDLDQKSANVILYPWSLLRLEVLLREEERNLARDTLRYSAPRQLLYEVGAGFGNYVFARIRRRKVEDLMSNPLFARDELTYLIRGGYATAVGSALAEAEFGTYRERVFGTQGPYSRIALFLNLFPDWFHSYGATLEYAHQPNLYSAEKTARWAGSISARYALSMRTNLYLSLQGNSVELTQRQIYTVVEASLDHEFSFGHAARIRTRYSTSNLAPEGRDFSWMAEYSVPFDFPLGRIGTVGGVRGRVLDAETGRGIADVILTIGKQSVLTDVDGGFMFSGVSPGLYELQVDVTTLGQDRILEKNLNGPIPVRGGEDTPVELRTVRGGEIDGRVTLNSFSVTDSGDTLANQYTEVGGIPSVLIEASRGDDLIRQLTDSRGRFHFTDIRPGKWTIRVLDYSVPENHRLENAEVTAELTAGETVELVLRVLPRHRSIRILNQGHLLQQ